MRKRFGMRSMMIGVAAIALLAAFTTTSTRNRIVVENQSGVAVSSLKIAVGKDTIRFGAIPSGGTAYADFQIHSDANFTVSGALADGSPLSGDFGYVDGGAYGETAHFSIDPGGKLRFRQDG